MSELFISKLISSVIQVLLFAFIPFVWFITSKNKQSFTSWLGLIGINKEKRGSAFIEVPPVK